MEKPISPRLAGVLLHTTGSHFPEMKRFYKEILGLSLRSERKGFVNFEWDNLRLTLNLHDRVIDASTDPDRILINFEVADISDWHERLTRAGVRCLREPSPEPWGGLVATYADPDGNLVQLMQLS